MDIVRLNNIKIHANHGWYSQERELGQIFEVDIALYFDLTPAMQSDKIEDTINFEDVYTIAKEALTNRSYHLIEAAAGLLIEKLFAEFARVEKIKLNIRKPQVPINGILDHAEIELERNRG